MAEFYAVLTNIGLEKLALAPQQKLELTTVILGDGGGESYNPTKQELIDSTGLVNQVYSQPITNGHVSSHNNTFEVRIKVPNEQGGWWVREAGIVDVEGDMVAVAKVAPFFKPISVIGVDRETNIRLITALFNAEDVTISAAPDPNDSVSSGNVIGKLLKITDTEYTVHSSTNGTTVFFFSDDPVTVTLPASIAGENAPTECRFIQFGDGKITVAPESGVPLTSLNGSRTSVGVGAEMTLVRNFPLNEWWLGGQLE